MYRQISIRHEDFDIGAEWQALRACLGGSAGAMAAFCGVVRDQFGAEAIETLELEHYPGMTERSIERILADLLVEEGEAYVVGGNAADLHDDAHGRLLRHRTGCDGGGENDRPE